MAEYDDNNEDLVDIDNDVNINVGEVDAYSMSEAPETDNMKYSVIVTGISWNPEVSAKSVFKKSKKKEQERPTSLTLSIPVHKLRQGLKKNSKFFNDVIESFVYDVLTRKFGHEVWHCQIWLPLEDPAEFIDG